MANISQSCIVASHITSNSVTTPVADATASATASATNSATVDLLALSMEVLRRNERNSCRNMDATVKSQKSCEVALPTERNTATQKLYVLIKQISAVYGGDDAQFLQEYFDEILRDWSYDIDRVIACFKDVAKRISSVNNSK